MQLGSVLGTLVSTRKYSRLLNWSFRVVQPLDHLGKDVGEPIVAVDTVGSRDGDQVMWVSSREAAVAMDEDWFNPVDAAIVGIVDRVSEVKKAAQVDLSGSVPKENL